MAITPMEPGLDPRIEMLVDEAATRARIDEMAEFLIGHYQGKDPLFITALKGAMPFTTCLLQSIERQAPGTNPELDTVVVKTYDEERRAGQPKLVMDIDDGTVVNGRPIVILDDLLDKGHTTQMLVEHFTKLGASSVEIVVLIDKAVQPGERIHPKKPLIAGFDNLSGWLIGWGMDDDTTKPGAFRWLNFIGRLNV